MYKSFRNIYYFYDNLNGQDVFDPFIPEFTKYISLSCKSGTVKKRVVSIHKFWIYMLYFPPNEEETFERYVYNYRDILISRGFIIEKEIRYKNFTIRKKIYEYKKLENSIKIEMVALEQYFTFINNESINPKFNITNKINGLYKESLNFNKLNKYSNKSRHSSYGLKVKGLMRYSFLEVNTVFSKIKKSKKGTSNSSFKNTYKAMPIDLLFDLLKVTMNKKQKLLYILCAGTSARIGQALTLTIYDVDVLNKKVYLTDPTTNQRPHDEYGRIFLDQPSRKDLLKEYGIFFDSHAYKDIDFKTPIPTIATPDRSLLFVSPILEQMFFDLYLKIKPKLDSRNPFVFQTETNNLKIIAPRNARDRMQKDMKKVAEVFPTHTEYINRLFDNKKKFHSLRHLFASTMAEKAAYLQEIENRKPRGTGEFIPDMVGYIKQLTAIYTGHELNVIDTYFNRSLYDMKNLRKVFNKIDDELMEFKNDINKRISTVNDIKNSGNSNIDKSY